MALRRLLELLMVTMTQQLLLVWKAGPAEENVEKITRERTQSSHFFTGNYNMNYTVICDSTAYS